MPLVSVHDEMSSLTQKLMLSTELSVLERAWTIEVGWMGGMARLAALDRATLVVEAMSSAAMQEIMLRRRELIRRINKHFKYPLIEQMTVRMTDGH